MPGLYQLRDELLSDGRIAEAEVARIRAYVGEDGRLDGEDMRFLVELLSDAQEVSPAFEEYFYATLKEIILEDGVVSPAEQFYLMKMLYSDGVVRDTQSRFLCELYDEAKHKSPELAAKLETAAGCHDTQWQLGGV